MGRRSFTGPVQARGGQPSVGTRHEVEPGIEGPWSSREHPAQVGHGCQGQRDGSVFQVGASSGPMMQSCRGCGGNSPRPRLSLTFKKTHSLIREGTTVRFEFIAKYRGVWQTQEKCEALDDSRGGFYEWLKRPRSHRAQENDKQFIQIRTGFGRSDRSRYT